MPIEQGQVFGRLTVLSEVKVKNNSHRKHYLCQCSCGNTKIVRGSHLLDGNTQSCGCLQRECCSKRAIRHGWSTSNGKETRLHRIWANMIARCQTPTHFAYERYGGRGITVCEEWHDYMQFHWWALLSGYADNLTIDRIDNDGNYEPENCRWVTKGENGRNQRTTKLTQEDVKQIRMSAEQGVSQDEIAKQFNVSRWHIHNIINYVRWNTSEQDKTLRVEQTNRQEVLV